MTKFYHDAEAKIVRKESLWVSPIQERGKVTGWRISLAWSQMSASSGACTSPPTGSNPKTYTSPPDTEAKAVGWYSQHHCGKLGLEISEEKYLELFKQYKAASKQPK
jgi:hypothetical protein